MCSASTLLLNYIPILKKKKKKPLRAGEMVLQLRTLAALAKNLGSTPSTYMVAHSHI